MNLMRPKANTMMNLK